MGALSSCLRASDVQDDNRTDKDSGDILHLKWFFQKLIRKPPTPDLHPPSQQPQPSSPGLILNSIAGVGTCSSRVEPDESLCGDNLCPDLKATQGEEISYDETKAEDSCPTCFYEYTEEHPKIVMKCSHHYHLSCIYEWMERSEYCPICREMMMFDESS